MEQTRALRIARRARGHTSLTPNRSERLSPGLSASSAINCKALRSVLKSILKSAALDPDPSRARRQRVFALPLRPTTRPPRCCVRVVGLGGWCFVHPRARDGEQSANGRDQQKRIGEIMVNGNGNRPAKATGERKRQPSPAKAKRGSGRRESRAARLACSGYGPKWMLWGVVHVALDVAAQAGRARA
jgi:hypothetical protein